MWFILEYKKIYYTDYVFIKVYKKQVQKASIRSKHKINKMNQVLKQSVKTHLNVLVVEAEETKHIAEEIGMFSRENLKRNRQTLKKMRQIKRLIRDKENRLSKLRHEIDVTLCQFNIVKGSDSGSCLDSGSE